MKRLRVYVDTSVFGGCFDRQFAEWSKALMEDFRCDRYTPIVSDVTAAEVAMAPQPVKEVFSEVLRIAENLSVTPEALELLRSYESHGILGPRFRNWDAPILCTRCYES